VVMRHQELQNAYGTEAMSWVTAFGWRRHIKDRNESVVDNAWSGTPSTEVTCVNIDNAEQLLKKGRTLSLRELSESISVSLERVHHTAAEESSVHKVGSLRALWWAQNESVQKYDNEMLNKTTSFYNP
jgi:hypothetical protein